MAKRSNFKRIDKDAYMTIDTRAVEPLLDYYKGQEINYYEPCVGNGDLIRLLDNWNCVGFSDEEIDARTTKYYTMSANYFVTNPPLSRKLLHPIIDNLRTQLPTWLLFDADWMHTQRAIPFMEYCKTIISVGRVRWIPGTTFDGKDNCAWYLFVDFQTRCEFVPRIKRNK